MIAEDGSVLVVAMADVYHYSDFQFYDWIDGRFDDVERLRISINLVGAHFDGGSVTSNGEVLLFVDNRIEKFWSCGAGHYGSQYLCFVCWVPECDLCRFDGWCLRCKESYQAVRGVCVSAQGWVLQGVIVTGIMCAAFLAMVLICLYCSFSDRRNHREMPASLRQESESN